MTESDLPMPCVDIEEEDDESCPCWKASELSVVLPPITDANANFEAACAKDDDAHQIVALIENMENGRFVPPYIQLSTGGVAPELFCQVVNAGYLEEPKEDIVEVTDVEFASCTALLIAHANVYQSAGIWDCFQ